MLSNKSLILPIAAFLIWLASVTNAQCTNKPFAPCKLYETADVVFIGTVKEINYSEPFDEGTGISKRILRNKAILLVIKEPFKGIAEKQTEITITTLQIQKRLQSGELEFVKYVEVACPFDEFVQDETYFVYARRRLEYKSILFADRAMTVAEAENAVAYLSNRKLGNVGAMLYGRVVRKMRPLDYDFGGMPQRPFRNIKVEIQSESQSFTTITDEEGNYLFSDVPPGEYSIKCDLPERLDAENNVQKLTVSTQSCKEYDIVALTTGQISGTVFSHDGKPLNVEVEIVVASEVDKSNPRRFVTRADWQSGKFEFKNIPPAQYLLGFNLGTLCTQPFGHRRGLFCSPRTYYPGVSDISQATLINLGEGEQLKELDFRLLPPFSTRTFSGVAVLPDGSPAVNAEIMLTVSHDEINEFGGLTKADQYGRFSLSAYNDLKYWIQAHSKIKGEDKHSEPVDLVTSGDVGGIRLVISSSGKFCSLCNNKYRKLKSTPSQ